MTLFTDGGARLYVTVDTDGDRATLALAGELDRLSGPLLMQLLDTAMDGSVKYVDVQAAQLSFVDAAGARVLRDAYQLGAGRGVALALHDPQPHVGWLLHIVGIAVLLLGDGTAPADTAMLYPRGAPRPVTTGATANETPSLPPADHIPLADARDEHDRHADQRQAQADDRERRADERDQRADEREEQADDRERRADERDQRADEREEQADDRDRLAQERNHLIDERQQQVSAHERWEDIREDVADARERDLERREQER
ncbi:STAS domain-containing protein [Actinoplanes sp. NPDC051346]|uniref:STAS domain-containing protein n=1 Tax=Actinoplanes sp. NPDC051346 TaxID=3155048 RepID=UPI003425CA06